jgi:glyoxylase-like metal-dependent hydrolase (beta-lactamase superfamily II)
MSAQTRYKWKLLRAGPLWLDGGSMFGIIPRVLWSKRVQTDEQGRICVAHNCLLLEPVQAVPGNPQHILIETGSGEKFDDKSKKIFGLTDYTIIDALREAGYSCEQIDQVVVSHLHFDHAGGLTRLAPGGVAPTFPNAPIIVQKQEWEDALNNSSVMTRTYLKENLEPVRQRMRLIESPPPFPVGYHPRRDEAPQTNLPQRVTEILPGIGVFRVPGHTWGQQAIWFVDDRGRNIIFSPDIIPTVNHIGAAYNMAYDVEPFMSTVSRKWYLTEAAARDWILILDHEPGNPCQRVRADGKGWFEMVETHAE